MKYRLIALDVDGTTVETGRPASPRVLAALARAQESGANVVVATGRAFRSAQEYAQMLGLGGPLICLQGALVKELQGRQRTLLADVLPHEPLADLIRFADERRLELTLYTESDIYVSHMVHARAYYDLWFSLPVHVVPSLQAVVDDLERQGVQLVKALFIGEPESLGPLQAELEPYMGDRLVPVRSHERFLEMLGPGVSKGRALAFLADHLGIPQAETIAVGDSGNDISMIRWAGLGVAVANASPDVRAAADWIAPSVADDGVAVVLERFVLNGRS